MYIRELAFAVNPETSFGDFRMIGDLIEEFMIVSLFDKHDFPTGGSPWTRSSA